MTQDTIREGGCGCGHVRYRMQGEPIMVHNCHCKLCQQQTGSTSVVNVFIESDNVDLLSGELTVHELGTGSGQRHTIHRCKQCGAAVWSHYPRFAELMTGLRAGTLDDPGSVTPDVVIFTDFKMPWVTLPEGIPAFGEYYDPRTTLPGQSVDRMRALAARGRAAEG